MTVLELDGIQKRYGRIQALKGVSLSIPRGSIYGILGPNGSGKTTLLSIVLQVLNADSGSYRWFPGEEVAHPRKQIGSLLETPNFYHYLSAVNNLRITRSISGRGDEAGIEKALRRVHLYERRNSRFSTYSLGMKQRLAIAGSLLGEPKVLVLDEPTNGLDPNGIAEIRDLMKQLHAGGHTIIMASHLLDEVEKVCTHVAILKTGSLVTEGPVEDVLSDEDIVEAATDDLQLLQAALSAAAFPGWRGSQLTGDSLQLHFAKGSADPAAINRFCWSKQIALKHLVLKKKRLETRFFELTHE
ncbi:MAG: ABC transporter ATP-binding protein [Flavihumibacter sp.]